MRRSIPLALAGALAAGRTLRPVSVRDGAVGSLRQRGVDARVSAGDAVADDTNELRGHAPIV